MKLHLPLPLALLALLVIGGLFAALLPKNQLPMQQTTYKYALVHIGSASVRVEVADTSALREKGLSGHLPLKENEGMLFVYQDGDDGKQGFWMKDMLFPIDIIWINTEGEVITIKADATPESYPEVFYPARAAKYVLEVPAGYAKRQGIAEGTKIVVEY